MARTNRSLSFGQRTSYKTKPEQLIAMVFIYSAGLATHRRDRAYTTGMISGRENPVEFSLFKLPSQWCPTIVRLMHSLQKPTHACMQTQRESLQMSRNYPANFNLLMAYVRLPPAGAMYQAPDSRLCYTNYLHTEQNLSIFMTPGDSGFLIHEQIVLWDCSFQLIGL